jgi:hypothetical protein
VQQTFQQTTLNFCGKATKNARDFTRSRGTTLARKGNSLSKGASFMLETVAKAVLIVVSPFLVLRKNCATSLAPRQLLKGDQLHKYGRLCDLFGVAAEVLSGAVRWRW